MYIAQVRTLLDSYLHQEAYKDHIYAGGVVYGDELEAGTACK